MNFITSIIIFTVSLIYSIIKNISIINPLLIGLLCFSLTANYKGFNFFDVIRMILKGMKKSLIVIRIFILIGIITAVWRACGTIPFFVYYGTKIIHPDYFILFAFLLSCIVSFALGTSFGTVGTIGVVLIVLAKGGNVDINITAGAIISGAYFGDRCAPTSSSANLVAALTETNLYNNVKNMLITGLIPFILSAVVYVVLSMWNPMISSDNTLLIEITEYFRLDLFVVLPAVIIFLLAIFRLDVKVSMLLSIIIGILICVFVQRISVADVLKLVVFGFKPNTNSVFADIISGGGLISMLKVSLIVMIASSYAGIFDKTNMLYEILNILEKLSNKLSVYLITVLTSFMTTIFSCNQTLSVILTHQLMYKIYENKGYSKNELAIDLENTVILIAVIVPWSIAVAVPIATLSADVRSIPYAVFLFLVPIVNSFKIRKKSDGTLSNIKR